MHIIKLRLSKQLRKTKANKKPDEGKQKYLQLQISIITKQKLIDAKV